MDGDETRQSVRSRRPVCVPHSLLTFASRHRTQAVLRRIRVVSGVRDGNCVPCPVEIGSGGGDSLDWAISETQIRVGQDSDDNT